MTLNDSSSVGALLACLSVNAKQFFSLSGLLLFRFE